MTETESKIVQAVTDKLVDPLVAMHAALDAEWAQHFDAAAKEGWFLSDTEGSMYGPLQVQKVDDAEECSKFYGFHVPQLESDDDAVAIVKAGTGPHHAAARDLVLRFNPQEAATLKL